MCHVSTRSRIYGKADGRCDWNDTPLSFTAPVWHYGQFVVATMCYSKHVFCGLLLQVSHATRPQRITAFLRGVSHMCALVHPLCALPLPPYLSQWFVLIRHVPFQNIKQHRNNLKIMTMSIMNERYDRHSSQAIKNLAIDNNIGIKRRICRYEIIHILNSVY